jgi:Tol biopolymer transport system component
MAAGTRIGQYEIVALLGAGGMGEVYRARDARLARDVAVKILPATFAADPDRLTRFEREARLLASLNHPNIGAIYGVEETGGLIALVLELVEGETLADRLRRGDSGLGIRESLVIARQICDALDAAHERGIVHRDLKPSNIIVSAQDVVKVVDFGLAKPGAGQAGGAGWEEGLTHSPTAMGPTMDGVLLGTAPYMSPEQARGKAVDKRTDVWAFGCVLFEMLTGRRPFGGETTTDILARIVEREPDWAALPDPLPAHLRRVLGRCLDKDPKRRLRDIGDARVELDEETPVQQRVAVGGLRGSTLAVLIAAVLLALSAVAGMIWLRAPTERVRSAQFTFAAPEGTQLEIAVPVASPDGTQIAFSARNTAGQRTVFIRPVGSTTAQQLTGTEGVTGPVFWSPDGKWLGFFAEGKLKKISMSGGPALNISTIQNNLGVTWNSDNVIVVAPVNRTVLHRVAAAGGTPEPLTTLNAERRENSHRFPYFLPDGRHFLFTARSDVKENNIIYAASLDSHDVKPLVAAQSRGVYAAPGFLLFARDGTIMAQRFDAATQTVSGDPFAVAAHVNHITPSSDASFSASADGSLLAYLPSVTQAAQLMLFDRTGKAIRSLGAEKEYTEVRLAPTGKAAGVVIADPESGNRDIWLFDLALGTLSRFTSHPANDWQLAWAPDGKRIAFASDRDGRSSIWVKPLDVGEEELLLRVPDRGAFPKDWSRDGRVLAIAVDSAAGISSLWAMSLVGDRTPFRLRTASVRENEPALSADGRWIAFDSQQTGVDEVYLAPFPKGASRRVSSGGGADPRWRPDGRELYYISPRGEMMVVGFGASDPIEPAVPVRLFDVCGGSQRQRGSSNSRLGSYDITPDGGLFLMACAVAGADASAIAVALDWTASLK